MADRRSPWLVFLWLLIFATAAGFAFCLWACFGPDLLTKTEYP